MQRFTNRFTNLGSARNPILPLLPSKPSGSYKKENGPALISQCLLLTWARIPLLGFQLLSWLSAWLATWYTPNSLLGLLRLSAVSQSPRPSAGPQSLWISTFPCYTRCPLRSRISLSPLVRLQILVCPSCMLGCRTQIRRLYNICSHRHRKVAQGRVQG